MIKQKKKQVSCRDFFYDYNNKLSNVLKDSHFKEIEKLTFFLEKKIKNKNKIFVCGNGGSAAIANHLLCDFNKSIKFSSKKKLMPKIISLSNSVELITAISNDINFDEIFKNQLENYCNKGDILLIFSSSGKSKNVLKVANFALKKKLDVISITGFGNKDLKRYSKFFISLNVKNYGITEDIFQSIMHMISQYLRIKNSKIKSEIY